MHPPDDHPHDGDLVSDLQGLFAQQRRRRALQALAGAGTLALSAAARAALTCTLIPEETAGPYPGDGSNSASGGVANALMLSGIVRRDIRASVGGASGVAQGVPLNLRLNLVNTNGGCGSLAGYVVYLWHCTRDGRYSMYSAGVTGENYLRGVQMAGRDGSVSFDTIFPGCYSGRMPHVHFEIYRSLTTATSFSNKLRTSQLAFPVEATRTLYASNPGYEQSLVEFSRMSFATDNVFSDGVATQLVSVVAGVRTGVAATLEVGIAV